MKKIAKSIWAVILCLSLIFSFGVVAFAEVITSSKAEQIALKNEGLTENNALYVYSVTDYEGGAKHYDVEFCTKNYVLYKIYKYVIDGETGNILSSSSQLTLLPPTIPEKREALSKSSARLRALEAMNLSSTDVCLMLCEAVQEGDGILIYKIVFDDSEYEYSCLVDAYSGVVSEIEKKVALLDDDDEFVDDDDDTDESAFSQFDISSIGLDSFSFISKIVSGLKEFIQGILSLLTSNSQINVFGRLLNFV